MRTATLHCNDTKYCTLHTVHCTNQTANCTLNTKHWKPHTVHCTLDTAQLILSTVHLILHIADCRLDTALLCRDTAWFLPLPGWPHIPHHWTGQTLYTTCYCTVSLLNCVELYCTIGNWSMCQCTLCHGSVCQCTVWHCTVWSCDAMYLPHHTTLHIFNTHYITVGSTICIKWDLLPLWEAHTISIQSGLCNTAVWQYQSKCHSCGNSNKTGARELPSNWASENYYC